MGYDSKKLLEEIRQLILKTIVAFQPIMSEYYKKNRPKNEIDHELCFEILGFDILIDDQLKPWLLEVNHTPSFSTDSELDLIIKKHLILDTLLLVNAQPFSEKILSVIQNDEKKTHF